jgi:hypothetical protein
LGHSGVGGASDPRYPDDLPDQDFYAQLTLDMGLTKVRANVEWCDDAIARITARGQKKSVGSA